MATSNRNTSRFARSFFLLMRVLSIGLPTVRELTALSTLGGIGSAVKARVDQAPRLCSALQSSRQLQRELSVAEKELWASFDGSIVPYPRKAFQTCTKLHHIAPYSRNAFQISAKSLQPRFCATLDAATTTVASNVHHHDACGAGRKPPRG